MNTTDSDGIEKGDKEEFYMGYADRQEIIEAYTHASLDSIEKILSKYGYEVQRSSVSITAVLKTLPGYNSNILVLDKDGIRYCKDTETSKGIYSSPKIDRLNKIISEAENLEK
ncbi:MAG TPA: hypothetical protein GX010_03870 [Erysipelotrichaceae bacterium]|nr:hypothetical protein [Erysipelotrichaceae bacterium]